VDVLSHRRCGGSVGDVLALRECDGSVGDVMAHYWMCWLIGNLVAQ
jgi:hypothetical protein